MKSIRKVRNIKMIVGDCLTCQGSFNPHSNMKLKRKENTEEAALPNETKQS